MTSALRSGVRWHHYGLTTPADEVILRSSMAIAPSESDGPQCEFHHDLLHRMALSKFILTYPL
jgi:hypothetical protein